MDLQMADPPHNHPSILRDLMFLEAWESGQIPWLGAILRVRQILRATPRPGLPASSQRPATTRKAAPGPGTQMGSKWV